MDTDDSGLPEEARKLPKLNIKENFDLKDLYAVIEGTTCRRCGGTGIDPNTGIDPDSEYPCLLCRGKKIEKFAGGDVHVCVNHPDLQLVGIGRRPVEWEDGQGFDHRGWLEVKGCPVCKIPARSVMFC